MGRFLKLAAPEEPAEEDPLAGVANLFDVSIVFIVGLMITMFSVYNMGEAITVNATRTQPFAGLSAKTIKVGYIGVLCTAVGEALRREIVEHNPFHDIRVTGSNDVNPDRFPAQLEPANAAGFAARP